MAYAIAGLNPGAENAKGGPFVSTYHSVDATATVEGAGYFNDASSNLDNAINQGTITVFDSNLNTTVMYGYQVSAGVVTLDVANKKVLD